MILDICVAEEGGWRMGVAGVEESFVCVARAEEVVSAFQTLVERGGGWNGLHMLRADAHDSASFTNRRLLSVWLNVWAALHPTIQFLWRMNSTSAWQEWKAPMEIPYHGEPNISSSKPV